MRLNSLQTAQKSPKEVITLIMGCYPPSTIRDPKTYLEMAAQVLAKYPPTVLDQLANPSVGILAKYKFPPAISEIVDMAERISKPTSRNFV